jgi:hypothetical protein
LNNDGKCNSVPTNRRNKFVDQSPFLVRSVMLIPLKKENGKISSIPEGWEF